MRGEIYVLSLLRVSDLAEYVAAEHLRGPVTKSSIVAELIDPDRRDLAGPRYDYLATKLAEAFQPPPLPRFAEPDFSALLKPANQRELARVLECAPDDTLASLLDPVAIRHDLDAVAVGGEDQPLKDVESLIFELLGGGSPSGRSALVRVRLLYQFSENEWGSHLLVRRWLHDSAVERLHQEAARRGWGAADASRILAALITTRGQQFTEFYDVMAKTFDALAIVYLRRICAGLVNDLRAEAESNIVSAISKAPLLTSLVKLRGWIDLYERDNLAYGLLKLCSGTVPLRRVTSRKQHSDRLIQATYEKPIRNEPLTVANVNEFTRLAGPFRRHYVSFDVCCRLGDDPEPVTVLTLSAVPADDFARLAPAIERLRGDDLSGQGATVGERLLNTGISVGQDMQGLLRGYVERNTALLAQSIVLAGVTKPLTEQGIPWRQSMRDRLGYAERDPDRDVELPPGLDDVVRTVQDYYGQRGRELTVDYDPQ